jgi:hypothetical protein
MRNLIEDRRVLRMQFEAFAHYARHESGRPESAYCFVALATSVDDVSPELLEAYVEKFQKIEHRKVGSALKQSIQQGYGRPQMRQNTWSASLRLHLEQGRLPEPCADGTV